MENESYTGATQRLYLEPAQPPADYAAPIAAHSAPRDSVPTWAMFALLIVVLLLTLARMPAPAPQPYVMPAVDNHVEVFSRNCVGYCP